MEPINDTLTLRQLLRILRDKGILLHLDGDGSIGIEAPKGALMPSLLEEIRARREELTAHLAEMRHAPVNELPLAPASASYPLSSSQLRLWLAHEVQPEARLHNISSVIDLDGEWDPQQLNDAVASVVERHEILRTIFRRDGSGEVRQLVLPANELDTLVSYRDLHANVDAYAKMHADIEEAAARPFEPDRFPLFRICLYRMGDGVYFLHYVLHHIISDGWSMNVLAKDVLGYYGAQSSEQPYRPAPLRIQYKDYAFWQQNQLEQGAFDADRRYWTDQLKDNSQRLELFAGRMRPAVLSARGHALKTRLQGSEVTALRELSVRAGGSLFMGLLAVVRTILYRYSGQDDLVIGTPIAGRRHADLHDQIGIYINTLPLRTRVQAEDSFEDLLNRTRTDVVEAYKHQDYPFDEILKDIGGMADRSRNALFDVMVGLQNFNENTGAERYADRGSDEIIDLGPVHSAFDLLFDFHEVQDQIEFRLQYNADIYEEVAMEGLMRHFRVLLLSCLSQPTLPIARLPYLDARSWQRLRTLSQPPEVPYDRHATLLSLFAHHVAAQPQATALWAPEEQLSYHQLDAQSTRLAHHLQTLGVGPGALVPLCLDRSPALVVALLAVLKAGAAYLPLDPQTPAPRLAFLVRDAAATLVLTDTYYEELFTGLALRRLCLDRDALPAAAAPLASLPAVSARDLAYVIYTSGSTGQPKGVMIEHTSVVNLVQWHGGRYGVGPQSRSTCMAGVAFDACALEIWSALGLGATLYLVPEQIKLAGAGLLDFYRAQGITHAFVPPALVPLVVGAPVPAGLRLRYMLVGGDRLAPLPVQELPYRVVNQYGPTESTVMVSDYALQGGEAGLVPIGRPLANTQVWVLDGQLQAVAPGVEGELCLGGAGLARGYWGRAELTAARFVEHPYESGTRLYRSGDRGYWTASGELCCSGRLDEQVKVRGYRIEPGEVEAALLGVAGVQGAAVVAVPGRAGDGAQLVAFYSSGDGSVPEAVVLAELSSVLPGYLVPVRALGVERLPLTLNGKVDRVALVAQYEELAGEGYPAGEQDILPPSNPVEEALCRVYAEVLRRNEVGRNQNFFDLGGDSIKAILLINKLRQQGYTVQVGDVLRYPVVHDLALKTEPLAIHEQQAEESIEGEVPLTPIQRWFLDGPQQHKHHYNQSVLLFSRERIDAEALKAALDALVRHHHALRMKFMQTGTGSWQQYNRPADAVAYGLILKELDDIEMIPEFCTGVQMSLNLEEGVLVKAAVMRLPDGDRLLLVVHHLVVDGVSWRILLEDLSTAYLQFRKGTPITLPPKTDSFKLWAERLHAYASNGLLHEESGYWKEVQGQLAGTPGLPLDHPEGRHLLSENRTISFELPAAETLALQGAAHRAYNTQINELLLATLSLALGKVFGAGRAVILLEGHGREASLVHSSADISRTVGWFTITYPVLIDRIDEDDAEALLTAVVDMKEKLRAVPGKGLGYGLMRYLSGEEATEVADADITFNYLGDFGAAVSTGGGEEVFQYAREGRGAELHASAASETALGISGYTSSGVLHLSISYSPDQYKYETVHKLLDAYKAALLFAAEVLPRQEEGRRTPSDLSFKGLGIDEVRSQEAYGRLEDIYPLSPLQEGIYFHWLSEPGTTAYINQTAYRVRGVLDIDLLRQSYGILVARHGILRTRFTHQLGTRSLQVVYASHPGHFRMARSIGDEETFTEIYKEKDRDEGFDLGAVSQMRLSVIRLKEDLHEFVWTHHHILMDGWCGSILINEFYTIYRSLVSGQQPSLPATMPYANYIRWLSALQPVKGLDFWKHYLEDYDTAVSVPQKSRQAAGNSYSLEQLAFRLEAPETAALKTLCQSLAITESTFVQAAWGYLLSRYGNTGDVVFGAVVSGRPAELPGVETAIGLFINTIPVRVRYEEQTTVRELLQHVQQQAIEALPYHYLRLNDVQAQSMLGNRLFDHIVVYENYWVQDSLPEGTGATGVAAEASPEEPEFMALGTIEQTSYDFNIMASVGAGQLSVRFSYNGEQYAKSWIEAIGTHFHRLLLLFLQQPDRRLSAISYLPVAEAALLHQLNATGVAYPQGRTIVDLFCRQAEAQPAATALSFGDETLSYRELDESSNRLARHLLNRGAGPGQPTPVCLDRGPSLVIALMAVLKAGAAYVPIDPQYPPARISYMLEDSRAALVITDSRHAALFTEMHISCIELDREESLIGTLPAQPPALAIADDQLAYIIYTSGSTGQPKGVMISHRSAGNFIEWCLDEFRSDAVDVVFAVTSICFDLSVFEIFYPLAAGKRIRIVSEAAALQEELGRERRILLNVVPSLVRSLLENGADLSSIVSLNMAGEPIAPDIAAALDLDVLRVRNLYGPTEATTYSTFTVLHKDHPITIGRPLANTEAWVLDRFLQPMPVGVRGEIYLGGRQLAEGYWNKEDLTREKFIVHPFHEGERLYRTGDAGYWSEEGELFYGGRLDDQLKLRGFRIEPGEIEAVLQKVEGVRQAAVVAVGEGTGLQLTGFYTADEPLDITFVSGCLQEVLPSYMVPARLQQLAELPLTVNGKTDRKALANLYEEWRSSTIVSSDSDDGREQPQSPEEEALCLVYGQVLQRAAVGRRQGFFDLGGDSIKAILLINRLRQQGYSVQVNDILRYPIVADLAQRIKPIEVQHAPTEEAVEGEVGLTSIQRWFLQTSPNTGKHHYNQSVLLHSAEPLYVHALEQALAAIARHHDALRMVFERLPDGAWRQYNRPPSVPAHELVVTELADADALGELCTRIQASFQLDAGPLLKAALLRLPDGDRLLLVIHHLVVDGVSWRILLEDLSTVYRQALAGAPLVLPAKTSSFRLWSEKVYDYVRSHRNRQQLAYWQDVVREAGSPDSRLAPDSTYGPRLLRENKSLHFSLAPDEITDLQGSLHRDQGIQVNEILLAALGLALGKVFGQGKAVLQLEGHGREATVVSEKIDIGRTVGWFTTLFPVVIDRTEPTDRQAMARALAGIKKVLAALPNKGFDYGLLRYLDAEVSAQMEGVQADITFNYLGDFGSSVSGDSSEQMFRYSTDYHGDEVDGGTQVDSPIVINSYIMSSTLHVDISYAPAQFHNTTIDSLKQQYRQNLLQLIEMLADAETGSGEEELRSPEWNIHAEDLFGLTYNQQNYYRNGQFVHAYGSFELHLHDFEEDAFLSAFNRMVADHAILRVRFLHTDSGLRQYFGPSADHRPLIFFYDARDRVEAERFLKELKDRPFDLLNGEILRCGIVRYQGDAYIQVTLHHIITDGYSNNILHDVLLAYYRNRPAPQEEQPYSSFITAQQQYLQSAEGQAGIQYWNRKLAALDPTRHTSYTPVLHRWLVDGALHSEIIAFCKTNDLLLSSFLLAVYYRLLTGRPEIGNPVLLQVLTNGREGDMPGFTIGNSVGQFVSRLPLVLAKPDDTLSAELVRYIQEEYLNGRANQQVPNIVIGNEFARKSGVLLDDITDQFINLFDFRDLPCPRETYSPEQVRLPRTTDMPVGSCILFEDALVLEYFGSDDEEAQLFSVIQTLVQAGEPAKGFQQP